MTSEPALADRHRQMLAEDSGISDEIIASRGYETVTTKARLRTLGFPESQLNVPTLLIPVFNCRGDLALYQSRPDAPRMKDGKVVKYETVKGATMALDIHPSVRHLLGDPSVPLFITEGIKKGDALASRGACAIALLGVWNWRGSNVSDGKTALADWEYIALNGRPVVIVFDSDVMRNRFVHGSLVRLRQFLEARGATVTFVFLEPGPHGEKVGVDDFFGGGASLKDLLALVTFDLRFVEEEEDRDEGPYRTTDEGIIWIKQTKDGPVEVPLTNFTARITADIVEDDGVEERRSFEIEAAMRDRKCRRQIPVSQFAGMTWATEHLGAAAGCFPGVAIKDHARFAIQCASGDVPTRRIYSHTGWRRIDDEWMFLHGAGAISADGLRQDVETKLSGALARFILPAPADERGTRAALAASLRLLELGPYAVTVPLVGSIYLAPLCELLEGYRPDLVSWFNGPTGVFKSEAAALAESHFGTFTRQTLPATFTDTPNAVERILFSAKDVLAVIDDFHPSHDRREEQAMATNASRLLRGVGNGSGRQRMRADTSLRPDLPPRGLAVATGERLPAGHSAGARMLAVTVAQGDIAEDRLTEAQASSAEYPVAMAGYIQRLAGRFDELRVSLQARFKELRDAAQGSGHPRNAAQIAHLQLGIETLVEFAREIGAIDDEQAASLGANSWSALTQLGRAHQDDLAEESPVHIFLSLLADGLAGRRAVLDSLAGGLPDEPETFGWFERSYVDARGDRQSEYVRPAAASFLGHADDEWLYLIPDATMQFVTSAASGSGRHFPVDRRTLLRRLAEAKLIALQDGRRVVNQRIAGTTHRVIKLRRASLSLAAREQGEHGEHEAEPDSLDHLERSPNETAGGGYGNAMGVHAGSERRAVPAVPVVPAPRDVEEERDEVVIL